MSATLLSPMPVEKSRDLGEGAAEFFHEEYGARLLVCEIVSTFGSRQLSEQ
jgi:hypothetical protein